MTVDPASFRLALGHFCTGVTVITADDDDEVRAMTASAICSVSLDPPMVLACIGAQARIREPIRRSGRYAISVLSQAQQAISVRFSRSAATPSAFDFASWEGLPVVDEALVHLAVEVRDMIAAGDHLICLGEVTATRVLPGEPLIYFRGGYHGSASPCLAS
jgi:flavin reductase (DIM6/NTAB) family NADH-FMN oxidoreductase RutF